jgi:hypothetical protein
MNSFPLVLILLSLTAIAKAASNDGNPFIAEVEGQRRND